MKEKRTLIQVFSIIVTIVSIGINVFYYTKSKTDDALKASLAREIENLSGKYLGATNEVKRLDGIIAQNNKEIELIRAEKQRLYQQSTHYRSQANVYIESMNYYRELYESVNVTLDYSELEHLEFFFKWSSPD